MKNISMYATTTNARHRQILRRALRAMSRPARESESWETRKARWLAELMEGFEPA